MNRKYYEAYDDRYRQIHAEKLKWFDEAPSSIVAEVMEAYEIKKSSKILEIGCGEGRDARNLLKKGYDLLATDISPEAIHHCRNADSRHSECYSVLDCLSERCEEKYDFIYAIAVLHMLVVDEDRDSFYQFIKEHLKEKGIALICTMGDGVSEQSTDPDLAFDLQERIHEASGKVLCLARTSYRSVSFPSFKKEIINRGLEILEIGFTDIQPDYWKMMYAVVRRSG